MDAEHLLLTKQWWLDHIWEFIAAMGKVHRMMGDPCAGEALEKCKRQ